MLTDWIAGLIPTDLIAGLTGIDRIDVLMAKRYQNYVSLNPGIRLNFFLIHVLRMKHRRPDAWKEKPRRPDAWKGMYPPMDARKIHLTDALRLTFFPNYGYNCHWHCYDSQYLTCSWNCYNCCNYLCYE